MQTEAARGFGDVESGLDQGLVDALPFAARLLLPDRDESLAPADIRLAIPPGDVRVVRLILAPESR